LSHQTKRQKGRGKRERIKEEPGGEKREKREIAPQISNISYMDEGSAGRKERAPELRNKGVREHTTAACRYTKDHISKNVKLMKRF